jgi:hypothetical protein
VPLLRSSFPGVDALSGTAFTAEKTATALRKKTTVRGRVAIECLGACHASRPQLKLRNVSARR